MYIMVRYSTSASLVLVFYSSLLVYDIYEVRLRTPRAQNTVYYNILKIRCGVLRYYTTVEVDRTFYTL